jgi:hypothetical protein
MTVKEFESAADKQRRELREIAEYNAEYARLSYDAYKRQGFTERQIMTLMRECDCMQNGA